MQPQKLLNTDAFPHITFHAQTHTLDKNGSLYDPSGTESCDMQIRLVSYLDKDEYIYIYIYRTTVATSCAPKSCGYVYTGPGEVSSLVTDPPGTPVTPRL